MKMLRQYSHTPTEYGGAAAESIICECCGARYTSLGDDAYNAGVVLSLTPFNKTHEPGRYVVEEVDIGGEKIYLKMRTVNES